MRVKEELIIIRHGRSQHNVGATDSYDSPLTEFGEIQARTVGKYLRTGAMGDLSGFVVHVSPFLRCLMTADFIRQEAGDMLANAHFKIDPLVSEYLSPGKPDVHIPRRHEQFSAFNWDAFDQFTHDGVYINKPELSEHYLRRIHKAFDNLSNKSLVVSHGMPCLTLALEATGPLQYIPVWDHSINNCSVSWVENGRKKWHGRNLHHEVSYQDHKDFNI